MNRAQRRATAHRAPRLAPGFVDVDHNGVGVYPAYRLARARVDSAHGEADVALVAVGGEGNRPVAYLGFSCAQAALDFAAELRELAQAILADGESFCQLAGATDPCQDAMT